MKLYTYDLHNLYHYVGNHIQKDEMGRVRGTYGKDHLEDLGVDGRIIIKYILTKLNGMPWNGFICQDRGW
jgi:hypothetical protein